MAGVLRFHDECGLQYALFVLKRRKHRTFYKKMPPAGQAGRNNPGGGRRHGHPIKAARTAALCRVFSVVQGKDRPYRGTVPEGGTGRRRGSRNKMLSPRKGIPWAWHEQGTGTLHPQPNIILFLYIPQHLGGLRNFFIRHISISFPNRLQKDTMLLSRAYLRFFGCAFFALWDAGISRCSGAVRRPSSLENCLTKFQDWRESK